MFGPIMCGPNELVKWWVPAIGMVLGVSLPIAAYLLWG